MRNSFACENDSGKLSNWRYLNNVVELEAFDNWLQSFSVFVHRDDYQLGKLKQTQKQQQ